MIKQFYTIIQIKNMCHIKRKIPQRANLDCNKRKRETEDVSKQRQLHIIIYNISHVLD